MPMRVFATLILVPLAIACNETAGPSVGTVAGVYVATTFTSTSNGVATNYLAEGGNILVLLANSGITEGQLVVPGGNDDGSTLIADLTGTWALSGSTVELDHAADTFLRDMSFTVSGTRLLGDATFGDLRIQVTLAR